MKGDFSRLEEDSQYTCVLMQQGRVQLDSDWNEQALIQRRQLRRLARQIFKEFGRPDIEGGFEISVVDNKTLRLSKGYCYIHGLLCFNPAPYDVPLPTEEGQYAVALEAWESHVSIVEAPSIGESALGGVDTSTRIKTRWRPHLRKLVRQSDEQTLGPAIDRLRKTFLPVARPDVGLTISLNNNQGGTACSRGQHTRSEENQLYRIEVRKRRAKKDDATLTTYFLWARDNASVVFAVRATQDPLSGKELEVPGLTSDARVALHPGDWVELEHDHQGWGYELHQIASIDPRQGKAVLKESIAVPIKPNGNPRLRLWKSEAKLVTTEPVDLENGLQVQFSGSLSELGDNDSWTFRVRDGQPVETEVRARRNVHYYHLLATATLASDNWTFEDLLAQAKDQDEAAEEAASEADAGPAAENHASEADDEAVTSPSDAIVPPTPSPFRPVPPEGGTGLDIESLLRPRGLRALRRNLATTRDLIRSVPAAELNHQVQSAPLAQWLASALVSEVAGLSLERFLATVERSVSVDDAERDLFVQDAEAVLSQANLLDGALESQTRLAVRRSRLA